MLSVELDHIAEMLEELNTHQNISSKARDYSSRIRQAVWDHTITSKGIFAYETDGFGGQIVMDDGNVPVSPSIQSSAVPTLTTSRSSPSLT
jgi:meiotically up-regulated gene 157 (Mug157) protein